MRMSGQHFSNTDLINKHLYNGKELQDQTNYLDYGFRQMDPQLGRWHVVDLLAEKYFSESPYSYAGNNPINNIDIMGLTYRPDVSEFPRGGGDFTGGAGAWFGDGKGGRYDFDDMDSSPDFGDLYYEGPDGNYYKRAHGIIVIIDHFFKFLVDNAQSMLNCQGNWAVFLARSMEGAESAIIGLYGENATGKNAPFADLVFVTHGGDGLERGSFSLGYKDGKDIKVNAFSISTHFSSGLNDEFKTKNINSFFNILNFVKDDGNVVMFSCYCGWKGAGTYLGKMLSSVKRKKNFYLNTGLGEFGNYYSEGDTFFKINFNQLKTNGTYKHFYNGKYLHNNLNIIFRDLYENAIEIIY